MSDIYNIRYVEDALTTFDEALKNRDWSSARDIAQDLKDKGFKSEAQRLFLDLAEANPMFLSDEERERRHLTDLSYQADGLEY